MMTKKIRTFSEGITTGSRKVTIFQTGTSSPKGPIKVRTKEVENAIEYLRRVLKSERTPEKVGKATHIVRNWRNKINSKEFLETALKGDTTLQQQEHRYLSKILGTKFPTVQATTQAVTQTTTKVGKVAKEVISKEDKAEKILKVVAGESKTLQKALTKTALKRILPKIIPLLGVGLTAFTLTNQIRRLLGKSVPEKFEEINPRVPQGDNYHPSVGWY